MAFKLPAHLHRNRYGVLYFRLAIPEDLRPLFGVRECWRSLGTSSVREASLTAQTLKASLQQIFCELRCADPARLSDLVRDLPARLETASLASGSIGPARTEALLLPQRPTSGLPTAVRAAGAVALSPIIAPTAAPSLSEAIEAYIRAKQAKDAWTLHTERANRASFALLKEHFGDRPLNRFSSEDMIAFVGLLKRLPANLTKMRAKEGKSLEEVAGLGLPPMAPRTTGECMSRISSLFRWCCKAERFQITFNPAEEFAAGKKQATYERRPFTNDELAMLFSTSEFTTRRFRFPHEYWLMPLGLFTAARLGELCQIALDDFVSVDGIDCIAINDERPEQSLKNDNARRLVPIHSQLVTLGLLSYVENLRQKGETRLFPELTLEPTTSHEASKWFGRYRRRAGVTAKQETVFHSFRHGFITFLLDHEQGISEHQIAPIVGHEAKLITGKVYWNKRDARKRKPIVNAFQVDESVRCLIPAFGNVQFTST